MAEGIGRIYDSYVLIIGLTRYNYSTVVLLLVLIYSIGCNQIFCSFHFGNVVFFVFWSSDMFVYFFEKFTFCKARQARRKFEKKNEI